MRRLGVWLAATVWFAWVSGLSAYGVVRSREAGRLRDCSESGAVAALYAYLLAQGTFQRQDRYGKGARVYANPIDGTGFQDLYRIGGPLEGEAGDELKLIDIPFARATSPRTARYGYWFIEIVADRKAGAYDFTKDCGLCAVPAVHGNTGLHTLVIDIRGTVYMKGNGGTPVTVFPDVEKEGWRAVGE